MALHTNTMKRKLLSYRYSLQRSVLLLPAIFLVIYTIGKQLSSNPPTEVINVKKDLHGTIYLDEVLKQNAYPSMTSGSNDTYYSSMSEDSQESPVESDHTVTVLAISNHHYVDLTTNWLRSIETLHIYPNITIIATDDMTHNHLSTFPYLHLILARLTSSPDVKRSMRSYFVTKWSLAKYMLTQNQDVLMTDVDTVWLENPFPYLSDNNYDMFISWDPMGKLCPGFMYLRSTPKTIEFVTKFVLNLSNATSDTTLLNSMINNRSIPPGLQYSILDPYKFISGRYYFNNDWRTYHSDVTPAAVHSNGVDMSSVDLSSSSHQVKMELFKKHGLWYLNGNTRLTWDAGTASIADE